MKLDTNHYTALGSRLKHSGVFIFKNSLKFSNCNQTDDKTLLEIWGFYFWRWALTSAVGASSHVGYKPQPLDLHI